MFLNRLALSVQSGGFIDTGDEIHSYPAFRFSDYYDGEVHCLLFGFRGS